MENIEKLAEKIIDVVQKSNNESLEDLFTIKYSELPASEDIDYEAADFLYKILEFAFERFGVLVDTQNTDDIKRKYEMLRMFFAETDEDYEDIKLNGEY